MEGKKIILMFISIIALLALVGLVRPLIDANFPIQEEATEEPVQSKKYHITIYDEHTVILNNYAYPYDTVILVMQDAYKLIGEYVITVKQ